MKVLFIYLLFNGSPNLNEKERERDLYIEYMNVK